MPMIGGSALAVGLLAVRATVILQPYGPIPEATLEAVEQALESALQVAVQRRPPVPLPQEAWYPPRRRYRAEKLLEHLGGLLRGEPESVRVLGLTGRDISTTKGPHTDWGVFGLGELGGRACVISSFRLRRKARDRAHAIRRLAVTAVHEVGHTLGLRHCPEAADRCVMQDAGGSIRNTDTTTGRLGPGCQAELDRLAPAVR